MDDHLPSSTQFTVSAPTTSFHPSYVFSDGDLVLMTTDCIAFRVHSSIMKLASGMFRDMLSVPRADNETPNDPINVEEKADVLAALLDIVYPSHECPEISSLDFLRHLAVAADKYDMPVVTGRIRSTLIHDSPRLNRLELYELTCKLGWEEEAELMARMAIEEKIDICEKESEATLRRLGGGRVLDLVKLQRLHPDEIKAKILSARQFSRTELFGECPEMCISPPC